jgi:guanylate kinase
MTTRPDVLLITGDPGAGKTTRCRALCDCPGFVRWASWTTRPPRPGEVEGFDYVFVTAEAFDAALAAGRLLEHVTLPGGHRYGLPRPPARADGECLVAIVDEDAGERLTAQLAPLRVEVERLEAPRAVLVERMRGRGDDDAAIAERLRWRDRRRRDDDSSP